MGLGATRVSLRIFALLGITCRMAFISEGLALSRSQLTRTCWLPDLQSDLQANFQLVAHMWPH
eukprot:1938411-Karenia_brevis.AAC.1